MHTTSSEEANGFQMLILSFAAGSFTSIIIDAQMRVILYID